MSNNEFDFVDISKNVGTMLTNGNIEEYKQGIKDALFGKISVNISGKKLNKTDLISSLRLFRRYNLIEVTGDLTSSACKVVILPTILMAIKSEDITEVFNTINKINQEEAAE